MSLHAAFDLFLSEYPDARLRTFAGHSVAEFIRTDVKETLEHVVGASARYMCHGSAGQGNWARAPWAAVFDRLITESAQDGYYIVYLVKEDFSGIYLSLNQGVTAAKKQYGGEAKSALRARAVDFQARLGPLVQDLHTGTIDLAAGSRANLSAFYESGSICSIYYARADLPPDEVLDADLHKFLRLYFTLASSEAQLFERADAEDDEDGLGVEDLRVLREHKRIERNRNLARRAKQALGYVCMACGFDFATKYGDVGKNFIEAHHLSPLANLRGQRLLLNPRSDFAVLCSNCHRMIHKTAFVGNVEAFRSQHLGDSDLIGYR